MGTLPASLAEIVDDFAALGDSDKVTLLLEFAGELPALPDDLATEAMEPVPECQSPVFLSVDAADADATEIEAQFAELAKAARARLIHEGVAQQDIVLQRSIDMMYRGQWRSLAVNAPQPIGAIVTTPR